MRKGKYANSHIHINENSNITHRSSNINNSLNNHSFNANSNIIHRSSKINSNISYHSSNMKLKLKDTSTLKRTSTRWNNLFTNNSNNNIDINNSNLTIRNTNLINSNNNSIYKNLASIL
jgi:hypothetical protein